MIKCAGWGLPYRSQEWMITGVINASMGAESTLKDVSVTRSRIYAYTYDTSCAESSTDLLQARVLIENPSTAQRCHLHRMHDMPHIFGYQLHSRTTQSISYHQVNSFQSCSRSNNQQNRDNIARFLLRYDIMMYCGICSRSQLSFQFRPPARWSLGQYE